MLEKFGLKKDYGKTVTNEFLDEIIQDINNKQFIGLKIKLVGLKNHDENLTLAQSARFFSALLSGGINDVKFELLKFIMENELNTVFTFPSYNQVEENIIDADNTLRRDSHSFEFRSFLNEVSKFTLSDETKKSIWQHRIENFVAEKDSSLFYDIYEKFFPAPVLFANTEFLELENAEDLFNDVECTPQQQLEFAVKAYPSLKFSNDFIHNLIKDDIESHVDTIIDNIDLFIDSNAFCSALEKEKFFTAFINNEQLHQSSKLRELAFKLAHKNPAYMSKVITHKEWGNDTLFFHLYNLGFSQHLSDYIRNSKSFSVNAYSESGISLIKHACDKLDFNMIDAIINHNSCDYTQNISLGSNKSEDRDIVNYLLFCIGQGREIQAFGCALDKIFKKIDCSKYMERINELMLTSFHAGDESQYEELSNVASKLFEKLDDQGKKSDIALHMLAISTNASENDLDKLDQTKFNHRNESLSDNFTALEIAFLVSNKDFIEYAFKKGISFNNLSPKDKFRLLVCACQGNDLEMLKKLTNHTDIDVSKLISMCDSDGRNLLHHAKNQHIAKYLLEFVIGHNTEYLINSKDSSGKTPVKVYAESNSIESLKLLIKNGADINIADNSGDTPLIAAAALGNVETIKCLCDNPALQVNHCNKEGASALDAAQFRASMAIPSVQKNIQETLKINVPDIKKLEAEQTVIIAELINKGADSSNYSYPKLDKINIQSFFPAGATWVRSAIESTGFSLLNNLIMGIGANDNPGAKLLRFTTNLNFSYGVKKSIDKIMEKVVPPSIDSMLNTKIKIKNNVLLGAHKVHKHFFYTKVSEDKSEGTDKVPVDDLFSYISNYLFGSTSVYTSEITNKDYLRSIGIVSLDKAENSISEQDIYQFISTFKETDMSHIAHAEFIHKALLSRFNELQNLKDDNFMIFGVDKIIDKIVQVDNQLIEKTNISYTTGGKVNADKDFLNLIDYIRSNSVERSCLLHYMISSNSASIQNFELFINNVKNGEITVSLEQYRVINQFKKDLDNARSSLYTPSSYEKFTLAFFVKSIVHSVINALAKTYFTNEGRALETCIDNIVNKFSNINLPDKNHNNDTTNYECTTPKLAKQAATYLTKASGSTYELKQATSSFVKRHATFASTILLTSLNHFSAHDNIQILQLGSTTAIGLANLSLTLGVCGIMAMPYMSSIIAASTCTTALAGGGWVYYNSESAKALYSFSKDLLIKRSEEPVKCGAKYNIEKPADGTFTRALLQRTSTSRSVA